jgi:uncharacterized membrane protein YdfJ with MMPL/SSD domain
MIIKIRFIIATLVLGLLAFLSVVFRPTAQNFQVTETPGPKARAALALQAQAGNTDGIVFVGILIFFFIAIPLLIRYNDTRSLK